MSLSTKQWVVDDISDAALFDENENPVGFFDRLNKMTIAIDAKQQRVYGGTSKYAFHLTEQDAESGIQLENAVLDYNMLLAATGAELTNGQAVVPFFEKLTVLSDSTVTITKGADMVANSDRVIVVSKDHVNAGKKLERVAATPTALQYTVAAGIITFGDATLAGKDVRVFGDYNSATASGASITTTTRNKAYKFVAYGRALDDDTNEWFDVVVIIYKAQMLGTFSIDQQRKSATSNSLELAVLDANRADKKVIDIIAS
ncbi:hypothetical protein BBD42_30870 [Paenibacillus sp. BIHB 4019]|uniref:Uncharacterized protein n=1 Tax=Paenibacillus sp. BIHB 4019 TaxID=1870819 RepID=A0A1B2DRU5_9BACL|nr:hypothetical protein [Paenibacillus sp. BIHB 4019]ANY70410.1 hypothetical protein BBD42_30870 [Paenibacillus sp. BIHB 4019]